MNSFISYFCPHWGNVLPFDTFCKKVKLAGYTGVEMDLPVDVYENEFVINTLRKYHLKLIGQYWQSIEKNFATHKKNYKKYLYYLASANPILINTQTGKDYFSFGKNMELISIAEKISIETGIEIAHETHRGKFLYNLPVVAACLKANKNVKLTLDASHFCTVHESLLEDQQDSLNLAIKHTKHFHARIGHSEGPQVNDPRAPEWETALQAHLNWWDRIVAHHRKRKTLLSVTTEFGPTPYMPTTPFSNKPLSSQWDINVFMLELLKKRYN